MALALAATKGTSEIVYLIDEAYEYQRFWPNPSNPVLSAFEPRLLPQDYEATGIPIVGSA